MAEGANLLQLIEENTLSVKPNHTLRLLKEAIEHVSEGKPLDDNIDSKAKGSIKLVEKILIPQKEFPFINFKGHLLGAGGKILRKIQDETESKIMILGAGSMKDNAIEEELKRSGNSMYKHLEEPLHICVVSEGPPMIAFTKMGLSLKEITKILFSALLDDMPIQEKPLVEQVCKNIETMDNQRELLFSWNIIK
ncbi:unnamed protein product [Gordionus sp. m RMFG-2023]